MPDDRMWPSVPAELRYVDLRLPGTFRELVANKSFTNEEVGKIVRCLALDTDFFITQKIEAEVLYYLAKLRKNNRSRMRMEAMRNRRKATGGTSVSGVTNHVTVTLSAVGGAVGASDAGSDSISSQKTPSIIVEKTPPIIPLEKKPSSSLEKGATPRRKDKTKGLAGDLQGDLFALATASCAQGSPLASPETGQGGPVARPEASDGTSPVQYIERAPRPLAGRVDAREDAAWIPERFTVFWSHYPKKVAKTDAVKAFTKIIKAQPDVDKFMAKTLASLNWWKSQPSWTKDNGKFVPYPATWLNRGHWGDCSEVGASSGGPEFLRTDAESDAELIKRMQGG